MILNDLNIEELYNYLNRREKYQTYINQQQFNQLYEDLSDAMFASQADRLIPCLTYILYKAELCPLNFFKHIVPSRFAYLMGEGQLPELEHVHINEECVIIGYRAFSMNGNIKTVEAPTIEEISSYAFDDCDNLETILLKNCKSINAHAFSNCNSLTSVYLPDNLHNIYAYAFSDCKNLESLSINNLPKGTTTNIADSSFIGCPKLQKIQYRGTIKQFEENESAYIQYKEAFKYKLISCDDGTIQF